jgi:phytoene dehydrogenase-like protein
MARSLLQDRIVRELELARHGYHVDAKDPSFFSAFPDGRHLFFWQDERSTLEEIAKFSQRDAERFPAYEAYLERLAKVVESLLLVTPPDFPPASPGDFIEYLKLLGRFRGLSRAEIVGLVKIFTQSAADFLSDWFESEELKVTLRMPRSSASTCGTDGFREWSSQAARRFRRALSRAIWTRTRHFCV